MGGDLGGAIKGFRSSMKEVKDPEADGDEPADQQAEASLAEPDETGASEEVKTEKV
jgi:Sec-independent protein translocase protein TatA